MFSEQCSDIKVIYAPQTLLRERSDTHVGLGLSLEHDPWKREASAYLGCQTVTCMCTTKRWVQTHSFKVGKSYHTNFSPAEIDLLSSLLLMTCMMHWFGILFQVVSKLSIHCESCMKGLTGVNTTCCTVALALLSYRLMCEQSRQACSSHYNLDLDLDFTIRE